MAAARRVQRICRHVVATAPATRRESPAAPPAGLSASSSAVISVAAAAAPPRPRIDPVVVTLRGDAGRANGLPGTNELSRTVTIRRLKPTDMVAALAFCRRLLWRDRWHYNPMESTVRLQVQNSGRRFVSGGGVHLVLVETRVEEYDGKRFEYEEIYGEAMYSWPVRQTRNGKTITGRSIFGLAVDREFQGTGAGRALITRLLEIAERHRYGPEIMSLGVQDLNERAWRLYEDMGFVRVPEL